MKLLMVGDTHGDFAFASKMARVAQKYQIKQIVQLGDFGIWDHRSEGVYFLDELDKNLTRRGVKLLFVPGNHENYDRLENYESVGRGTRTPEGFVNIRDNILYSRKVNFWEWEGQTFKAVGGAVSIDKAARTPGKSWWWQEQLTNEELAFAVNMGPADFLFTHDCPTNAPFKGRLKPDLESVAHRQKMNDVGRATKAKVWFHGHMHSFYDYYFEETKVWGLECNDNAMYNPHGRPLPFKNMGIFDTVTLQVEWPDVEDI